MKNYSWVWLNRKYFIFNRIGLVRRIKNSLCMKANNSNKIFMKISKKLLFNLGLLAIVFIYGLSITFFPQFKDKINGVYMVVIPLLILLAVFKLSAINQIKVLLACSMIGIDYPLMLIPAIIYPFLILIRKYHKFKTPALLALFFLLYACLLYFVVLVDSFNLLSFPFWLMSFGSGLLLFIYYAQFNFTKKDLLNIFNFFIKLTIVQFILVVLQLLRYRDFTPGDWGIGSLNDANKVGFYLLILLVYFLGPLWTKFLPYRNRSLSFRRVIKCILWIIILFPFIVLCAAKTLYGILFISIIIFFFGLSIWSIFRNRLVINKDYKALIVGGLISIVFLALFPVIFNFYGSYLSRPEFTLRSTIEQYTNYEESNQKYQLYKRVFKDFYINEGILIYSLGTGPGTFDSRASNSRAYDILYKKEDVLVPKLLLPYSSIYTKKYLADLYTRDIYMTQKYRSSLLSIPFAGIASLKAELGVIGLIFFLLICWSSIYLLSKYLIFNKREPLIGFILSVWWIFLPFAMVFDNFQEKPQVVFPLYLLTAVGLINNKEKK